MARIRTLKGLEERQHELLDRAGIPRRTDGIGELTVTERLLLLVGRYERLAAKTGEGVGLSIAALATKSALGRKEEEGNE